MDLFKLAADNKIPLEEDFKTLKDRCPPPDVGVLDQFVDKVKKDGRISINMRPRIAADFVRSDSYLNMYEAAQEAEELSNRSKDEILRERLGGYYIRRTTFDASFNEGKSFKYGALNIGGIGAPRYGLFCVVLNNDFSKDNAKIAYIKKDSLNHYTSDDGVINEGLFLRDLAVESNRQNLAAIKHAGEIENRIDDWPEMFCCEKEYMEAIFIADLNTSNTSEVRITESDYKDFWNKCFNSQGRDLSDGEKALAHDFVEILRANRSKKIKLCEVSDD
jgi:hypothetical protein